MLVRVYVLRRQGVKLRREQIGEPTPGCLFLRSTYYGSREHAQKAVAATLRSTYDHHGHNLLEQLWDAVAVNCNSRGILFRGFERTHPYAPQWRQAWWCELASSSATGTDTKVIRLPEFAYEDSP